MEVGYLPSIGLRCVSRPVALLKSRSQGGGSIADTVNVRRAKNSEELKCLADSSVLHENGRCRERFFVLKAKNREPFTTSQKQQIWALRSHTSCSDGEQPHQRLAAAQRQCQVVLLFAEHSEHAWVGYALMDGDPWFQDGSDFPHVIRVRWKVLLPHANGVLFSGIASAGDAHKVFNGDEISECAGKAIRTAIDDKEIAVRLQEKMAHSALVESAFLSVLPDETEPAAHRRLLGEVENRLGKVIFACMCGSRRYNLHFPESDFDLLVVYAAKDQATAPPILKNPSGLHPDYMVIEVGRFAQMLNEGDPRMVESLFLQQNVAEKEQQVGDSEESAVLCCNGPWASLLSVKELFISRALVNKYLGDATGRAGLSAIQKNTKRDKHRKILYVAFRTLTNALQACTDRALVVRRLTGSPEHDFIMEVRRGDNGSVEDLLPQAESLASNVRSALEVCDLEERPDPQVVAAWLVEVRAWAHDT